MEPPSPEEREEFKSKIKKKKKKERNEEETRERKKNNSRNFCWPDQILDGFEIVWEIWDCQIYRKGKNSVCACTCQRHVEKKEKKKNFFPFSSYFSSFPSFFFFFFIFFPPTSLVTRQFVRALQGKWQFCTGEERQEIRKVRRDGKRIGPIARK